MNERFKALAAQQGLVGPNIYVTQQELERFAQLIYKDISTVVAAHALSNDSALDVFKNLKRIYEGVQE